MAGIDIDPFSNHDKTDSHPDTGENILLYPEGAMGGSTLEPEREQEASFGGGKNSRKKAHQSLF